MRSLRLTETGSEECVTICKYTSRTRNMKLIASRQLLVDRKSLCKSCMVNCFRRQINEWQGWSSVPDTYLENNQHRTAPLVALGDDYMMLTCTFLLDRTHRVICSGTEIAGLMICLIALVSAWLISVFHSLITRRFGSSDVFPTTLNYRSLGLYFA